MSMSRKALSESAYGSLCSLKKLLRDDFVCALSFKEAYWANTN